MIIKGEDIGPGLIEALRIPKNTTSLEMSICVGEPVKIKCEYFLDADQNAIEEFYKLLQEYQLVKKDV